MATKREIEQRMRTYNVLQSLGFTYDECESLRRISMTLHRWFELECGDGNEYGSWAIERDDATEKPYFVRYHYGHGARSDYTSRRPVADREAGARRRLARIISDRNGRTLTIENTASEHANSAISAYVQTDPRGAALYILRPGDVPAGEDVSAYYSRGICVY